MTLIQRRAVLLLGLPGLCLPLATTGCSDPLAVEEGILRVAGRDDAFSVRNLSGSLELVVVIVDAAEAPVIDLAPCDEWPDPIAPGGRRSVPYDQVIGDRNRSDHAVVHWCQRSGGTVVGGGSLSVEYG